MSHTVQPINAKSQKYLLFRFLGAILIPTIFLCISMSFGIQNIHKQYLFTKKEISGTQAVYILFGAFTDLQKIRGLSRIIPWNKTANFATQRQEIIDTLKNRFNTPESQELSRKFGIEKEVAKILLETQSLYETKYGTLSEDEIFNQYTVIIGKINSIILVVADRSNLIIDPELDTYYQIEIAVKQIPDLCEAFAIIRGLGSGIIAQKNCNEEENKLFQEKISVMRDQLKKFNRAKSILREVNPDAQLSIKDNEDKLEQTLSSFSQTYESLLEYNYKLSAKNFFQRGSDIIDILAKIFYSTTDMLKISLNQRLTGYLQLLLLTLLLSTVTIAAIFYFSLSFYRLQQNSYRKLELISITDPLTSIPNRRYLDIVFDSEIQRARRDGRGIAFGLMDIDFFKRFNDTYGHHEGDLALKKVAGALKSSLQRAGDFYFRFGGEEFCFLFSVPSLTKTKEISECIRAAVEQLEIEHRKNSVSRFITISLGVAFLPKTTTEDLNYMIKQADTLLYKAKSKGRNQCVVAALES